MRDGNTDVVADDPARPADDDSALEIAKRLYFYAIAAVGLALLAIGLANLLELSFSRLEETWNDAALLVGGAGDIRRQVSVHVAMLLVALPIWLVHWFFAERAATRDDAERCSTVRALFLALALAVPLIYLVTSLRDLLYRLFLELGDDSLEIYGRRAVPEALALLVVAGGVWGYHAWVRLRDERTGPLPARAQWPTRLYLYGAAFAGAMLLLDGVVDLLGVTVDAIFEPGGEIARSDRWWVEELAGGLANALAGLLVWGSHWGFALSRIRDTSWVGLSERRSILRRVYLYLAAFTGVVLALVTIVRILDALFQSALGVFPDGDDLAGRLVESFVRLIPFGVLWFYHRRRVVAEAAAYAEAPLQAGVRRVYTYGAALIGLAFAGLGLARLTALSITALSGDDGQLMRTTDAWRDDVSFFAAITITGAAAWLWHWYLIQRAVVANPTSERAATTRRAYLFTVLGVSVVAALGGLSVVVYRILSALLDVTGRGDFVSDIAGPTGIALIALAIFAYHGLTLRADIAARPDTGPKATTQRLLLSGPAGSDLDPVVASLRQQLPEGFDLRHG